MNDVENVELNESRAVELVCEQKYDGLALHWMNLVNSKVIPLIIMFIISIAFIYLLRRSRHQIHSLKESGIRSVKIQLSRRENRQTFIVICFNALFFLLNLPNFIIYFIVFPVNSEPSDLVIYTLKLVYYVYYAVGFYVQIIVNREFRNEFLKLLNLRIICLEVNK